MALIHLVAPFAMALAVAAVAMALGSPAEAAVADDWYRTTRCDELSRSDVCRTYERCKATHRCARGDEDYDLKGVRLSSYTRDFASGNRTAIPLMNDFEDWKTGTFGWKMQHSQTTSMSKTVLGWDSLDFTVIGALELQTGYIVFDTDTAQLWGDVTLRGELVTTLAGTRVAVFNFMTVALGKNVTVRFQGNNAISIMSRSSIIIDTTLRVRAGTLGGFPGGGGVGAGDHENNNRNGPGSTSVRVYVKTVSTSGTRIPEVQEIETSAAAGQKLLGHFIVSYEQKEEESSAAHFSRHRETQPIPYDVNAYDLQKYLEASFPKIGELHVERDDTLEQSPEIGRLWRITFLTAVGNIPQLQVRSLLSGLSSQVVTRTVRDGNELSGFFRLSLLGAQTRPLRHNTSANDMRERLLEDFTFLVDATVERTDALSRCLQGATRPEETASSSIHSGNVDELYELSQWMVPEQSRSETRDNVKSYSNKVCRSGRDISNGFVWKIQFWTTVGNHVATSPSSDKHRLVNEPAVLTADASELLGDGATVEVVDSLHFSLSFGGEGASFAGNGGIGYLSPFRRPAGYGIIYSTKTMEDLLGGSGGAGGGRTPIDVFPVVQPTFGGAGGGAIQLSAVNDILIGSSGKIAVDGGGGGPGYTAGGGGAAGSILVESGGAFSHHGVLQAMGGHGGASMPSRNDVAVMSGGGGSGGRIAVYAQSFATWGQGVISVSGGAAQDPLRVGESGTSFVRVHTSMGIRVDPSIGAAGTSKSLLVAGTEDYTTGSIEGDMNQQSVRNGPRFVLEKPSRPERISYFVRVGSLSEGKLPVNRGAIFGIHAADDDGKGDNKDTFMIAVGVVNGAFTHGANLFQLPGVNFFGKVQPDRWYKVDVFINWYQNTYEVQLNDVLKVSAAKFDGNEVASVSVGNFHAMSSWWDELFVGENHLKDFKCPFVMTSDGENSSGTVVVGSRQLRKLWATETRGPDTEYHDMIKHSSHVSEREVYQHNDGDLVPFDGEPHRKYFNDVREYESEIPDGTADEEFNSNYEIVSQSETLTLFGIAQDSTIVRPLETGIDVHTLDVEESNRADAQSFTNHGPTIYWYSEVHNATTGFGAIGACSTLNYVDWRNEGIMISFANLSDPFGDMPSVLLADRPKVLFNKKTKQFVMWMHVDNATNSMGLTGVSKSTFPNGPFHLVRTMYPDAPLEAPGGQSINETHDQTVAVVAAPPESSEPDRAYLIRTYFKTVEFWLPRPVMDPLWQSVQTPEGITDFGLSYHRAFYHKGYDNPNDIYLQRWRMEDMPWETLCCELTNLTDCATETVIPSDPLMVCPEGMKKIQITGQSQMPAGSEVRSRYKDPLEDANSYFMPNSVPSHTTWGAQVYNDKTWRGTYFDALSTNITRFMFHRFAGERRRVEVDDDPAIPFSYPSDAEEIDFIAISDLEVMNHLLGTLGVPISVAFRAKYSAFDLAAIDVNRDGKITAYEVSQLKNQWALKQVGNQLGTSLMADFETMKWDQVILLDSNSDGKITYSEFEAWIGLDPNLMFDRFDLDKSGYLDENELARLLWYRQLPRLDSAIILLDPSFDGRVYYPRFREQLLDAPDYMFNAYDFDSSSTLTQDEIDLMISDLGVFAHHDVLESLKAVATDSISKADYVTWVSATTSLLEDSRNNLKVDNAIHGTRPDSLSGPMHVVERRRAKYVAISRLSNDYLSTEGLISEVEGDFEGREALINFFAFSQDLFGLSDEDVHLSIPDDEHDGVQPFRLFLSPETLGDRASYWNGRYWEGRPSAPAVLTYGQQCFQYAGVDVSDSGCLPCLTRSPFVTAAIDQYQSQTPSSSHCRSYKELDAYIKAFDQQVSIQLQYQQQTAYGVQGLQPHMSPCFNQSQFFPCDVHKVLDGNIADGNRNMSARVTAWNLAWERSPDNIGSSQKIRANDLQPTTHGPSFVERFPNRDRAPGNSYDVDIDATLLPDQMHDIVGGGT